MDCAEWKDGTHYFRGVDGVFIWRYGNSGVIWPVLQLRREAVKLRFGGRPRGCDEILALSNPKRQLRLMTASRWEN